MYPTTSNTLMLTTAAGSSCNGQSRLRAFPTSRCTT
jgi:hypothetical protein